MQKYELAMLLKPLLPDDIKTRVSGGISKLADKFGGKLTTKDTWGKKHLAYPIRKHEEGFYIFFTLEMDPAQLAKFQQELKRMDDVLRFLVIREDQL